MITIVIPYFQREAGVLRRALRSVAAQRGCPLPLHVIVVDDASPVPAEEEVLAAGPLPATLQVLKRPNGGPGAARNSGLDSAPPETRYIAFLDSDDEWMPGHLVRAAAALEASHDFYFSDFLQLGATVSAFARAGRIHPHEHPPLSCAPGLHAYRGDLFDQTLRANVIGTPTVVYDFARFAKQRFKVEFTNAGEDYLFWMDLALAGARVAFSSHTEVRCGRGVNVYAASGWGSESHLLRVHNEIKFKKLVRRAYPVTREQKHVLECSLDTLRLAFARDLFRRITHRQRLPLDLLATHLSLDPLSYLMLPAHAARVMREGMQRSLPS